MVKIKLKKSLKNEYPNIQSKEELKKKNLKDFCSLENVIKQYENFTRVENESYYTDDMGIFSFHDSKGKLKYDYYPDPEHGGVGYGWLKVEFVSRFSTFDEFYYSCLDITLYGDTDKMNIKIIDDLASEFKSFEKDKPENEEEQ